MTRPMYALEATEISKNFGAGQALRAFTLQVRKGELISLLGPQKTAHSRLTFAQAFNSLGTTIFPLVGSVVILGSLATITADQLSGAELQAYRQAESEAIWQG